MLSAAKLATLERHRRGIWGLCYRMTGDRAAGDDLAQESIARAIERAEQASDETFEGWLYRVATTTCLDWLRRRTVEENAVRIVDPLLLSDAPVVEVDAESRLLRRDDLRLAVLTSLQALTARQRAVLVLRDVLDRSTAETASTLGLSEGNVKVLLHRARAELEHAHRVGIPDVPVDATLVETFARALEAGDVEALAKLLAEDAWGLVDDGAGRRRPTLGARAIARQWANAIGRYGTDGLVRRLQLNSELALLVTISGYSLATIHLETRGGLVISTRVVLDPPRLARLGI
jgi:RNA polymerase sigma-70 factor (ECF subfamily)